MTDQHTFESLLALEPEALEMLAHSFRNKGQIGTYFVLNFLDEMATADECSYWVIPLVAESCVKEYLPFREVSHHVPGKPSESFPKAVYIAYILWKQENTK